MTDPCGASLPLEKPGADACGHVKLIPKYLLLRFRQTGEADPLLCVNCQTETSCRPKPDSTTITSDREAGLGSRGPDTPAALEHSTARTEVLEHSTNVLHCTKATPRLPPSSSTHNFAPLLPKAPTFLLARRIPKTLDLTAAPRRAGRSAMAASLLLRAVRRRELAAPLGTVSSVFPSPLFCPSGVFSPPFFWGDHLVVNCSNYTYYG
jgi:hypothetical protein